RRGVDGEANEAGGDGDAGRGGGALRRRARFHPGPGQPGADQARGDRQPGASHARTPRHAGPPGEDGGFAPPRDPRAAGGRAQSRGLRQAARLLTRGAGDAPPRARHRRLALRAAGRRGGWSLPSEATELQEGAMFLRNAWYVAAWDHEVSADALLGRVV